jgi:hypothetical protein
MMMEKMDKWPDEMLVDLHKTLQQNLVRLERAVKDYQVKIEEKRINIEKMGDEIKARGIGLQRH